MRRAARVLLSRTARSRPDKLWSIRVAVVVTVSVAATVAVAVTALITGKRAGHLKMLPQSRQRVGGESF